MTRLVLIRTVGFFALHRYWRADWTEEENRRVYGPLADPPGHGHDYRCTVSVSGPLDESGMVMDLGRLDAILAEEVVERCAGRLLNEAIPAFGAGRPLPTCEALAGWLFPRIAARLPDGVRLERVRIEEDDSLAAECVAQEPDPA